MPPQAPPVLEVVPSLRRTRESAGPSWKLLTLFGNGGVSATTVLLIPSDAFFEGNVGVDTVRPTPNRSGSDSRRRGPPGKKCLVPTPEVNPPPRWLPGKTPVAPPSELMSSPMMSWDNDFRQTTFGSTTKKSSGSFSAFSRRWDSPPPPRAALEIRLPPTGEEPSSSKLPRDRV